MHKDAGHFAGLLDFLSFEAGAVFTAVFPLMRVISSGTRWLACINER